MADPQSPIQTGPVPPMETAPIAPVTPIVPPTPADSPVNEVNKQHRKQLRETGLNASNKLGRAVTPGARAVLGATKPQVFSFFDSVKSNPWIAGLALLVIILGFIAASVGSK